MKAVEWALVAAIGFATVWPAKADFWFDPAPGYGVLDYPEYWGGPYFVSGFGGEHPEVRRRYWGGPYFVSCSGWHPPFETYRMNCRPRVVTITIREHRRTRSRLK